MAKRKIKIDNTNRFVLFKNQLTDHPKAPNLTGKIDINGIEYKIAAWYRTSDKGIKYLTGVVQEINNHDD
jgi:hypothetical protein